MRLLLDANLSPSLVGRLADLYPGSSHVFEHGDIAADDESIWQRAKLDGFLITTRDTDFLDLSLLRGPPPKLILLRTGNVSTEHIEALLRSHVENVRRFVASAEEAVLIIDR